MKEDPKVTVEGISHSHAAKLIIEDDGTRSEVKLSLEQLVNLRDALDAKLSYKVPIWCPICGESQGEELFIIGRALESTCLQCEKQYIKTFKVDEQPLAQAKRS